MTDAGIVGSMILLDVDPSVVKPGWTPLIITILLAAVIALLMISMRRHMKRIQVPYRDELGDSSSADRSDTATHGPGEASSPPTPGEDRHTANHPT